MHTLDQYYRGTIVACRYSLPSSLAHREALWVLKNKVYNAISLGIIGENSKDPVFVRLDHLDLHNHVDWKSFDDFNDLESHHLATQPGWRVIVLHKIEADYLEVLDLSDCSNTLPPNPELLSNWPMYATWAPIQVTPYATRRHTFTVNKDTITKVVSVCHQQNTTLTGLLHGLTLVSLTRAVEEAKGFASRTPYDLRHFLPSNTPAYPRLQPKETLCNYVSVVDHEFDAELVALIRSTVPQGGVNTSLPAETMDIIWSVSARVRREIKARLGSGMNNDMIGIMKFVRDWRPQQESEARKPRYLSWLVTNLGVLDGDAPKTQQDEGAKVPSAVLSVSVMTVKDEQMCVTCTWQDCVVDTNLAKGLMGDLERWLNEVASQCRCNRSNR
ncbi:alcohol acetyltransferase-domain-containing protein [Hypoxylon sp. FL1150]|nr:alcohol acetyltransferase-domain-containing protein [Hypoxylon sp. FL1150]